VSGQTSVIGSSSVDIRLGILLLTFSWGIHPQREKHPGTSASFRTPLAGGRAV